MKVPLWITAGCLQRRHDTEDQTDQRGDAQSEDEHGAVDTDRGGARQAWRAEGDERTNADDRHGHAEYTADSSEEQALGEQLADQPALTGAEGGAERELAAPVYAAGEQQV